MERKRLTLEALDLEPRTLSALRGVVALAGEQGGRALLVGGCVRDALLGHPLRDLDVEIFDVEPEAFAAKLAARVPSRMVGGDFSVHKLDGLPIDVSCAGAGVSIGQAARRRDFTVNALAWDPASGELHDPQGGLADLEARVLRHGSERFGEDPLRVLRGMQLAARFRLTAAPETLALCRSLRPDGIAPERVFEEWRKLVLRGERISLGLSFLRDSGWLVYAPELLALVDCPQDPTYHPEGDVWTHTLHCMDAFAARRVGDARDDLVVGLAVLCHDFGKPLTTREEAGRLRSLRHEKAGIPPTRAFLERMTRETGLLVQVPRLVATHLAPSQLHAQGAGDAAVRRLARRAGSIELLLRVAWADHAGRPPIPADPFPAGEWLRERARALGVLHRAAPPILQGRHLVGLGLAPGPAFGPILEAAYEAQLDGEIASEDDALRWARARLEPSRA